jgi:glycosyltransferase involved in cell wall biosynthesis
MRILYTHRTQGVGAEGSHIMGMFEAFAELGHDIRMDCLPGCDPTRQSPSAPGGAAAEKPPTPSLLKRFYWTIAERAPQMVFEAFEFAYNLPLALRFGWRCLRFRPQLVYERYSLNTFAPSLLCKLLRIPHVLEVNDSLVIERSRPLSLAGPANAAEGFCLRASDLVITITERFKESLSQRYGLDPDRLMVLTNAVSRRRFDRPFDKGAARAKLGIKGGRILGGTGQFLAWHGLQDLVDKLGPDAAAMDLRFLFVGDGPARREVEETAARHGISDRVMFTGMLPIEEVPGVLSALDIAVIPSAAPHASPMKLIEYMALGLPIVAPDLPSIRAALESGDEGKGVSDAEGRELGLLFPAGDMGAMRAALLECLADGARSSRMGADARAHVFATLTWRSHGEQVLRRLVLAHAVPVPAPTLESA